MINDTRLGVTTDEKFFELTAGLYHKDACKSIPGMRVHEGTTWRAPVTWAAACAIAKQFPQIVLDESARAYTRKVHSEFVSISHRLALSMDHVNDGPIPSFRGTTQHTLFSYQESGAAYLSFIERGGLFDPMGTGKTGQVISTLRSLELLHSQGLKPINPYPALIVAPNSVKRSWADQYKLWLPGAEHKNVIDFGNDAKTRRHAIEEMKDGGDVLIVNWEGLHSNSRHAPYGSIKVSKGNREPGPLNAIEWNTVVADEAHRAKNPDAKQTRALWFLRNGARYRFALTGTPMANSPADLWALLFFLWPEEFPSKSKFIDRYCLVGYGDWGGMDVLGLDPEARAEFDQVTRHLWRRTPKEVALPNLPPKVPFLRMCTMKPKQAKQYKEMMENMLVEIEETGEVIVASNPLARMTRLLQFASATGTLNPEDNTVGLTAPSCKVDQLFIEIEDIEDHEQIVVFAQSRKLIELCQMEIDKRVKPAKTTSEERRRYSYGMITGKQSVDERANNVDAFQRGDLRIMLCTLAAGGVGITLTAANTMIFLQRSFSLIDNEQAEGRCHRIGSEIHESINVIDIVSEGTLDEHVRTVSGLKAESLEDLIRDKDRMRQLMTGQEVDFNVQPKPEEAA